MELDCGKLWRSRLLGAEQGEAMEIGRKPGVEMWPWCVRAHLLVLLNQVSGRPGLTMRWGSSVVPVH